MSEPVSNAQVEDVLASIRRLVSEDKKPARPVSQLAESEAFEAPADADQGVEKQDKLVLTPSLRVAEAVDQDEDISETPSPDFEDVSEDTEEHSSDDGLAEEIAEFIPPAPFHKVPDDWDDDSHSDPVAFEPPKDAPLILNAETQLPDTAQDAENAEEFSVDSNNITDTFKDTLEHSAAVLDAPMEPHQTALDHSDDEDENAGWREFLEDSIAEGSTEAADLTEAEVAEAEPAQETEDSNQSSVQAIAETVEADVVKAATLGAKIAALEAVIGKKQDNWEPDGVNEDDYSGTSSPVLEWEDHASDVSFELVEAAEPESVEDIPEEPAEDVLAFANDDDLLDEDALRDMVAEIVRQELQGALGERITRNVRKLVRREIHRALASQELE